MHKLTMGKNDEKANLKDILSVVSNGESDSKSVQAVQTKLRASEFSTPLGYMLAIGDEEYLYLLQFMDNMNLVKRVSLLKINLNSKIVEIQIEKSKPLAMIEDEMNRYFEGTLKTFKTPIKMTGTDFQKQCWESLLEIPYGQTYSYGEHTKNLGKPPSYSRAVGGACGANNLMIVIPCHRIVAATGDLQGFNSGKDRKEWLIKHEKKFS